MKYGFSLLLNEYIHPELVEYKDSKIFQIVCPECYEPIFKVNRNNKVTYFSHYKKDEKLDSKCSLRVDSLNEQELEKKSSESQGQNIKLFLEVFKDSLLENELSGNLYEVRKLIDRINNSEGVSELKLKMMDRLRELSTDDSLIVSFFDDYIEETYMDTKYSYLKQKEYALNLFKHLCSLKAKDNLGFLICYSMLFITERISAASKERKLHQWEIEMYHFIKRLVECKSKSDFGIIASEMVQYKLNPPWVQEANTTMLLKVVSEISHESFGVLVRFPFFKILKKYGGVEEMNFA